MIKDGAVLDYVEWCARCIGGRRRSVIGVDLWLGRSVVGVVLGEC